MNLRLLLFTILAAVLAGPVSIAQSPIPAAPTRWATDNANFLSSQTIQSLDQRLEAYERATGHQILVWIAPTLGGVPIEDFAVRTFEAWKVGRKGMDDGLVLFIFPQDRQLRIEVGYGLEGQVPDALASQIINDVITPRIRGGDPDGAVLQGVEAILFVTGGGQLPAQGADGRDNGGGFGIGNLIVFGIAGIAFLILFVTNPTLAIYLLASMLSGSRGHGNRRGGMSWGGGGGFSGGGGRSGGGGASGSW